MSGPGVASAHYRYLCPTEGALVYESRPRSDPPPTTCINDGATLDPVTVAIVRDDASSGNFSIDDNGVGADEVWSAAKIRSELLTSGPSAGVNFASNTAMQTWILRDEKPDGTNGGTFTNETWVVRDLNTVAHSDGDGVTLGSGDAANTFTLLAGGCYRVTARVPSFRVNESQARLYDVTNDTVVVYGTNASTRSASQPHSFIDTRIDIAADGSNRVYRIEHRCDTTRANDGFGRSTGYGTVEVYSVVIVERIGDHSATSSQPEP